MNFRDVLILFIGKLFLFLSFLFYFLLLSMPKVQSCDLFVNLITRVNIYSRDTAEERSHLNNRHEFICREKTVGFYVNKWQKSRCWVRFDFITGCMKRHKERFFFYPLLYFLLSRNRYVCLSPVSPSSLVFWTGKQTLITFFFGIGFVFF